MTSMKERLTPEFYTADRTLAYRASRLTGVSVNEFGTGQQRSNTSTYIRIWREWYKRHFVNQMFDQ